MARSFSRLVLQMLIRVHWLIKYAVVYPLFVMAVLVALVFWRGEVTPGTSLVMMIESVQREGYVIHDCTGPASRGELNGDVVKPLLSPVLQEDCTTVSTNAAGYAAHIDESYAKSLLVIWLLMGLTFVGGAVVSGRTPARSAGITWVRNARGNVFPECRPGKGAISPLLAGCQKRGETIVVYDPSAKFNEEDENEKREK